MDSKLQERNDPMDIDNEDPVDQYVKSDGLTVHDKFMFVWHIDNWEEMKKNERQHSEIFTCGESKWRILLFPRGNKVQDQVSAFLENVDAASEQAPGWHVCASFALFVRNPDFPDAKTRVSSASHRFTTNETDWGFNQLCKTSHLPTEKIEPSGHCVLENNKLEFAICVKVINDETGVLWHNFIDYDSKKETGFVGLKNQGATCYMNSLLQSLYFTSYFRRATFQIPTDNDTPTGSIPLALQRVFYNLQFSDLSVDTTELTKSFGWDALDSFMQHDVQEFNRVLQDNLENKMKGTQAEGAISKLFLGKMKSYIKCISVDFESSRTEDFYDIQLNVKGCKNLKESFIEYCAFETLEGENKYQAEGFGLQEAKKGVTFKNFPPVLHLQLKRFEYDFQHDTMVKINDRHEFPAEIDLDEFLETDEDRKTQGPQTYCLFGVLVHSGDLSGGHYCAFIKPNYDAPFYKFDDDRVVRVSSHEVFDDNFGAELLKGPKGLKRITNAYMLVYVRKSDISTILGPVSETDIPAHLKERLDKERNDEITKRKEREEEILHMTVRVFSDDDINNYEGFDLCNLEHKNSFNIGIGITNSHAFRVKRLMKFKEFHDLVAEKFKINPEDFRLWCMVGRQNKTVRPDGPVKESDFDKSIQQIKEQIPKGSQSAEIALYLERPDPEVTDPAGPKFLSKGDGSGEEIVLFMKYYDPRLQKIEYVGKVSVRNKQTTKASTLIPIVLRRRGLPESTGIKIFEEVKPGMIDPVSPLKTFNQLELSDGDILVFQPSLTKEENDELPDKSMPTVVEYFESISNRISVRFRERPKEPRKRLYGKEDFSKDLEVIMSKKTGYDEVAQQVASKLECDPLKLMFTMSSATQDPKSMIKRTPKLTLGEMIPNYTAGGGTSSVIFYDVLDMLVSEYEQKRIFRVVFTDEAMKEHGPFDILVPKTGKVADIVDGVLKHATSSPGSGVYRARTLYAGKTLKIYDLEDLVSPISDATTFYIDQISAEEECGENEKKVEVFHYSRRTTDTHSVPFYFVLRKDETGADMLKRLQIRSGLGEKEFGRVKVSLIRLDAISKHVKEEEGLILNSEEIGEIDMIGLDHADKNAKNARTGSEKAIKISG